MKTRNQFRGNCQCCGRRHAVLDSTGLMAKHGYTVENGWFDGVCAGQHYKPMQHDRKITDHFVDTIRYDCDKLEDTVNLYRSGKKHPARIAKATYRRGEDETMDWNDASDYEREHGLRAAIFQIEGRIRAGRGIADQLESLANAVHGQPLYKVEVETGPAPIQIGEKRKAPNGKILRVVRLQGARVYWKDERGFGSWTGSSAWRKYELA